MTQTANLQIVIGADSTKAQPALQQTAQATQAIGTAAAGATTDVNRMTQAASATTSATPALQQTAQATQAVGAAANSSTAHITQQASAMQQGAISAGQMSQAMRMLPVQMTDVAVSLASGMPVWMVAIQQGGQLKDSFGGIGPAARAVGGYVLGMVNPVTVAAAALGVLAVGAYAGAQESRALQDAIINSGNAAGVTSGQLMMYAGRIDEVTGTHGRAVEVLAAMAATGEIGAANMQEFATAAMRFEAAGGASAEEVTKKFAELGKAPLDAALKLNESQRFLTVSTYEQIKALTEQGRTAAAADVAQKAFADTINNRAGQMEANLGIVEKAWRGVGNAVAEAWDAIKSIGRDAGPEGRAEVLGTAINKLEANIKARQAQGYAVPDRVADLQRLKDEQSIVQSEVRLRRMAADQQARQNELLKTKTEWDKKSSEFATNRQKRDDEIEKARIQGQALIAAGLMKEKDLKDRIAAIEDKYKEKGQGKKSTANEYAAEQEAAKKWADTLTDLQRIQVQGEAATQNYSKAQQRLLEWFADPQFAQASEQQKQLAVAAFEAAHAWEVEQEAIKKADQAMREAVDAYNKRLDVEYRAAESIAEQLQKQLEHNAAIGLSVTAIAELELAKLNEQAVSKERLATLADEIDWSGQLGDAYRQQAADLRALAQAKKVGAEKKEAHDLAEEAKKSAKKAADEWEKSSEKIENTLTDALMRGFESGKGFAQTMRDTVANMFKTLILRPTISAVMTPISAGINSMFGGGGGSGGGGSNGMGLINTASNVYGMVTAGASMASIGAANLVGAMGGDAIGTLIAGNAASWGVSAAGVSGAAGAAGAMASAIPVVGAVLAIGALLKSLDDSGTMHTGGAALASSVDGIKEVQAATIGFGLAAGDVSDKVVSSSKKLAGSALGILQGIEGLTGKKSNWAVSTAFADDSSKDGAWGALRITRDNNKVLDWNDTRQSRWAPREFADGEAGAKQYGDAVAAGIKQAIDTIDLPDWAANVIKGLGDSPTLEELTAAMQKIQAMPEQALQAIGTSSQSLSAIILEGMRNGDPAGAGAAFASQVVFGIENAMYSGFADQITNIVATDLVTPVVTAMAAGSTLTEAMATVSIDTMVTKVQAAVAAFDAILSDETIQKTLQDLGAKLSGGVAASISAGTSGRRAPTPPPAYASSKTAVTADTSSSAGQTAAARQSKLPELQDEYAQLQIERMRALGNAEEALAKSRELALSKLDAAEQAQQKLNWAQQDENDVIAERVALMKRRDAATDTTAQALAKERDAIKEVNRALFDSVIAAEKAKEVDGERKGLQDELNSLTDTNAQALQRQRDALDESNRALFDQIVAARKAKEVEGQRKSLQDELNSLTDTNTQALARQRDALDESNRALFDQVVAARKAKEVEGERKSLQDELNSLTDTNAQALARQRDALDESNRALFDQIVAARKAKEVEEQRKGVEDQWLQAIGAESVLRQRQLDALDPANRGLQQMIYRLEDLRTASDKADQAVDKAYAVLEKSVNAQKETLARKLEADKKALQSSAEAMEKSVSSIQKVFDTLKSALKSTTVETEALNRAARMSAMASLEDAVGQVQSGVSIDKITGLESALETIGKPSEQLYGRFDQYARDQDKAADAMRKLEKHGGSQLSVAELTLKATKGAADALETQYENDIKALDATLEKWRESIEIQRGTHLAVTDVTKAVQGLEKVLATAGVQRQAVNSVSTDVLASYTPNQVVGAVDFVRDRAVAGDAMGVYSAAKSAGLTAAEVTAVLNLSGVTVTETQVNDWIASQNLDALPSKKFASGGAFGGGGIVQRPTYFDLAMMGEAGAEAIMPLANIGGKLGVRASGGMSADVVNAILGLYGYLQAIASSTDATALHTFNTKKAAEDMVDRGVKVLPALNQNIKVEVVTA